MKQYHVFDDDELQFPRTSEHVTDGTPCWCDPLIEPYDGFEIVIHTEPRRH